MTFPPNGPVVPSAAPAADAIVAKHKDKLESALAAIAGRGYWSAYPESPSPRVYGEGKAEAGRAAYEAHLGKPFELGQPGADGRVGGEISPYGPELGVTYEHLSADAALSAAATAMAGWRAAGPETRAALCVEMIDRINERSFEIASAVMHTSGQAFVMAFQAGGPHAQDRALEAVAYAYAEQTRHAASAVWEKPQGKRPPLRMEKTFTPVPRGIALVVGCNTFPTWNSYPGLFASLATGNAVIVKPHPRAVLPLAITVSIAREVLAENGFDPNVVLLAPEAPGEGLAAVLAVRPEVKIIDFTGSTAFGNWLEDHARQARVYTEKSGVNVVLIESTGDYAGMLANLAFSLILYSGQMCTTPQDLVVPAGGIGTDQGHKSVDEFAADLGAAIDRTLGPDAQAVELLGAIVNDAVLERLDSAAGQAGGRAGCRGEPGDHTSSVPRRPGAYAAGRAGWRRGRFDRLGVLRAGDVPCVRAGRGRGAGRVPPGGGCPRGAHRGCLQHRRFVCRGRAGRSFGGRGGTLGEPDLRGVRQPVSRVLRLPCDGREPGSDCQLHRR